MKMYIYFVSIIVFAPIIMSNSCSKSGKIPTVYEVTIDQSFDYSIRSNQYQIKSASLKDSLLTIVFEANICKNDHAELVFNGNYLKSMPPKAQLGLRFTENSKCPRNKVELTYNVAKIKYPGNKTTILLLPGIEPITF